MLFLSRRGGGASLEPLELEAELEQGSGQAAGGIAHTPARRVAQADVHQPLQEGACGDHDGVAAKGDAELGADAGDSVALDQDLCDVALLDVEMRLPLAGGLEPELVGPSCRTGRAGRGRWHPSTH